MIRLDNMLEGEKGNIINIENVFLSLKLMEMGCIPGELIKMMHIAPLGDPISIEVAGYTLSLRKEEAHCILIDKL